MTLGPLTYPFPSRSEPGATLFSAGQTVLKSTQSRSSELSPQSFCLLQVSVWLMQRPAGKEGMKTEAEKDEERAQWPRPHPPPLSHWKWSLQLTGASLHWADGWQALSSASSTLQGEPPNWDGLRMDRVRNCGGPSGSSSMTSFQHRRRRRRALEMRRVEREKVRLQTAACLFLGAGGAGGPGAELRQQAVDGAALLAAASAVGPLAQLRAAAPPVIIIVLELSVKQSERELLLGDLSRPQLSYL